MIKNILYLPTFLWTGFMIETDAHRNAAFCIYNAYQSPKLEVTDISVLI